MADKPSLRIGVARITQGLDYDVSAGVAYDLIADKETLVRVPITTDGTPTKAACKVQKIMEPSTISALGSSAEILLPVSGEVRTVSAEIVALPLSSAPPVSSASPSELLTDTAPPNFVANCWLGGLDVPTPAVYRIDLEVKVSGLKASTKTLGTRRFQPTGDLRLIVYPMVWPSDKDITNSELHPWTFGCTTPCPGTDSRLIYQAWDDAATAAVLETMREFQRVMPIRAGVGRVDLMGSLPHTVETPGLRFLITPGVYECPAASVLIGDHDPWGSCDARARNSAEWWINLLNANSKKFDLLDGRHRDRIDWGVVVTLNGPGTTGGQSCWSDTGPHVAGAEIDTNPSSVGGAVVIQELTHCIGLVTGDSPNSLKGNPRHSKNGGIPLFKALPAINMRSHGSIGSPSSALFASVGLSSNNFLEGWEWNQLRRTLLSAPRLDPVSNTYRLVSSAAATPVFVLLGAIDPAGQVSVDYSAVIDDLDLEPTIPRTGGEYALVFLGDDRRELGRLPFQATFQGSHQYPDQQFTTSLSLIAPLPGQSAGYEIRKGNQVLFSRRFSARAPTITAVTFERLDDLHGRLRWEAADPDGEALTYSIYLQPDSSATPELLAAGVRGNSYDFNAGLAPASSGARLTVEASDGFNVTKASSPPFAIPQRPPVLVIASPKPGESLRSGRPSVLEALAYDYTAGTLQGDSIQWRSDRQGELGRGGRIEASLTEGNHVLTVTARSPSGQSATREINVSVAGGPAQEALLAGGVVDLGACDKTRSVTVSPSRPVSTVSTDSSWLAASFESDGRLSVRADCSNLPGGVHTGRVLMFKAEGDFGAFDVRLSKGEGQSGSRADIAAALLIGLAAGCLASVLLRRALRSRSG